MKGLNIRLRCYRRLARSAAITDVVGQPLALANVASEKELSTLGRAQNRANLVEKDALTTLESTACSAMPASTAYLVDLLLRAARIEGR